MSSFEERLSEYRLSLNTARGVAELRDNEGDLCLSLPYPTAAFNRSGPLFTELEPLIVWTYLAGVRAGERIGESRKLREIQAALGIVEVARTVAQDILGNGGYQP